MLYKINRDLARLYSLRKDDSAAKTYQANCYKLFGEVYGKNVNNVKSGKTLMIHAIWMSKFDIEGSTDELSTAFHILEECLGSEVNYFGANC